MLVAPRSSLHAHIRQQWHRTGGHPVGLDYIAFASGGCLSVMMDLFHETTFGAFELGGTGTHHFFFDEDACLH